MFLLRDIVDPFNVVAEGADGRVVVMRADEVIRQNRKRYLVAMDYSIKLGGKHLCVAREMIWPVTKEAVDGHLAIWPSIKRCDRNAGDRSYWILEFENHYVGGFDMVDRVRIRHGTRPLCLGFGEYDRSLEKPLKAFSCDAADHVEWFHYRPFETVTDKVILHDPPSYHPIRSQFPDI